MTSDILIGYKVGTQEPIHLKEHHTIVSGMTGEAGKTTCIEGIVNRWTGKSFIVFLTKRGEDIFADKPRIKPFFQTPAGEALWRYVESMVQMTLQEKDRSLRSIIMRVCENAKSLDDVWNNVRHRLDKMKNKETWEKSKLIELNEYLKLVLPQLKKYNFSDKLEMKSGYEDIVVMDLTEFSTELQSMIIGSVSEEILNVWEDMVLVIPEAWEFLPNGKGSPAKLAVEALVRKGRVLRNFVILDSQDIAGMHPPIRKNVSNWILGKQSDENEAQRTIGTLPLPPNQKPAVHEIQTLRLGQFYTVIDGKVSKVFAKPAWMTDDDAKLCAEFPETAYEHRDHHANVAEYIRSEPTFKNVKAEPAIEEPAIEARIDKPTIESIIREIVREELGNRNGDQTISSESVASVTVVEKQVKAVDLDESTAEGKIGILAAKGFFNEGKGTKDIWEELTRLYPNDTSGYENFRKNVCYKVMQFWTSRPYEYLEKSGSVYVITDKGRQGFHYRQEAIA